MAETLAFLKGKLVKKGDYVYELPVGTVEGQKVPVIVYISDDLFEKLEEDSLRQAVNASMLPGVEKAIYVMPDVHVGYGFPVGGVMATDVDGGIISPGSVGYDINCGVRLIATKLSGKEILPKVQDLMKEILKRIPAGVGSTGTIKLTPSEMKGVLTGGARWAVERGYGFDDDLENIESNGAISDADPDSASKEAYERGSDELGTVGSGNHFIELQIVDEVFDKEEAERLGIEEDQVLIMVHSGSRGFGHQVCTDYLRTAMNSLEKYGIKLPDPQLACMPFSSDEGQRYFTAMCASANYAFANRQILGYRTAEVIKNYLGLSWHQIGYKVIYDHAHNIAKIEDHKVNGEKKKLVVHRKGATRSFPGQPVIIPGDMGRASYLLVGTEKSLEESFGTACHGAGRLMSRRKAKKYVKEHGLEHVIQGITVVARGKGTIAEEIPQAYKDVTEVVRVIHELEIAKIVARLRPIGTLKG